MGKAPSGSLPERVYASANLCSQLFTSTCIVRREGSFGTGGRTGVAHAGVVDFDADFMRFGGFDLHIFDREVFAGFPGYSGLCERLSCSSWRDWNCIGKSG